MKNIAAPRNSVQKQHLKPISKVVRGHARKRGVRLEEHHEGSRLSISDTELSPTAAELNEYNANVRHAILLR